MQRDITSDLVHHQDGLLTLSSLLSPTPFGPLDSIYSLAHGAHSGIKSPGSGLRSGGATDTFDATTGNIGFDSAAYARVLCHHQMLLRQMNEEYRQLMCVTSIAHSTFLLISNSTCRVTHEGLVEAHHVFVNTFTEATKRPYTNNHEPIVASSASPSLPPIPPLEQSDYPGIKYWSKLDWKKTENTQKDSSNLEAKHGGRGGARTHHRINSKVHTLKKDIKEITNNPDFDANENLRLSEVLLANQLLHLEQVNTCDQKELLHAKITDHGKKLGRIWSVISNEHKPWDLMRHLKILGTNPPQFERDTNRMVCLVHNYHDNLQKEGIPDQEDPNEYERAINEVLSVIPETQHLKEPSYMTLHNTITQVQVEEALSLAKNGSATGIDGCPYKLWKTTHTKYTNDQWESKEGFNIMKHINQSLFCLFNPEPILTDNW